mmetsp:Transcript_3108/g.8626  ORF Transcript_3108/g.8626 Transcript_3108/m.8626 type:complete len:592 (-) Transcript_3108:81-1856(-)|eukprot:CAMPEP_0179090186 /NCGR_PEP_ID=MMETSP0796-20121207/41132_1 /TAXON_ID=73915 /ORGANISM="Pyrodinium bahamense, Strain pbaha01" /LENGTH=591 /DNA_ID=CAMNT_0020787753 /DNA_START=17 /DNA_END=1792 /DNA_ORIENTATION=+
MRHTWAAWLIPLLLVPGLLIAQAAPEFPVPILSQDGRRLALPSWQGAAQALGVQLAAIHVQHVTNDAWLHMRHPVEAAPEQPDSRRLYSGSNRRDLVRLLMKLSALAYGGISPFREEVMNPIIQAGESVYGASIKSYDDEKQAQNTHFQEIKTELENNGSHAVADGGFGIDTAQSESKGVHALEFTAAKLGKVLVFRGTQSDGDYDQMALFITDWIRKRMTAQLKYQWVTLAKLPWTSQMKEDQAKWDPGYSTLLGLGGWWYTGSHLDDMSEIARREGLEKDKVDKVAKTGYWEFTKHIADSVRDSLTDENLTITGHSQGGARAALTSMYFEKKYGVKYDTVTFAAVGGLCFSRDLSFSDGHLKEDVDPFNVHTQVTDYVHPLDAWGHFDYDVGTTCSYGHTGLSTSSVRKYCEKVFGHQGVDLMVAGNQGLEAELDLDFARCRYFTHQWYSMDIDLSNDAFIDENGTADGGCTEQKPIPEDDPEGKCPSSQLTALDGCNDERSCEACMISTSTLGFPCSWCPSSKAEGKCLSSVDTYWHSCKSELTNDKWMQREHQCDILSVNGLLGLKPRALAIALLVFLSANAGTFVL